MQTVVGIFASRPPIERTVGRLRALGVASARINVLLPGAADLGGTPLSDTEQPGVAADLGAIVGGATGGLAGLAIAGTLMLPGVGIVTAIGLAAAATFSAVGAVGGAALEGALDDGLPVDEVYVYEDALRKGRTVVAVETVDGPDAAVIRNVLVEEGAESVDAAREQWWIGLHGAEEAEYRTAGGSESMVKKAVGGVLGVAAGIYNKVRSDETASRALRDDYAALCFGTVCYEMLHTTALALKDEPTAHLALRHLKDFPPLIMAISQMMPSVLIHELSEERNVSPDASVATDAVRNTRAAWAEACAAT